jgi:hypothetical protein
MHVEFWDRAHDVKLFTAILGPSGIAEFIAEPGHSIPWFLTDPAELPLMTDDEAKTFLTPADGERFLRVLPNVFRSPVLMALLVS